MSRWRELAALFDALVRQRGDIPAERAAVDRIEAGARELDVKWGMLFVEVGEMGKAFNNFAEAWQRMEERMVGDEADAVASHPDLAEVNVRLDALYDLPQNDQSPRRSEE